jgi:hypothetical protein
LIAKNPSVLDALTLRERARGNTNERRLQVGTVSTSCEYPIAEKRVCVLPEQPARKRKGNIRMRYFVFLLLAENLVLLRKTRLIDQRLLGLAEI